MKLSLIFLLSFVVLACSKSETENKPSSSTCQGKTILYGQSNATPALISIDQKISHVIYDDYYKTGLIMVYHQDHHGIAGYGTVNFKGTFKFQLNGKDIEMTYDNWELKRVNLNPEMMNLFRNGIMLEYDGHAFDQQEAEKWRQAFVCLSAGYQ